MSLSERWQEFLESLEHQGRYRRLSLPCGIDFSSNDYLGYVNGSRGPALLKPDAQTKDIMTAISGTASRLLRGHRVVWEQVEEELARWHGSEAALMMNSGYVANEGLLSTIIEPGDWVASDEFNHASIIDGLRLTKAEKYIYRHNDLNHLESGLNRAAHKRSAHQLLFIVTESLFSMAGDVASLSELVALAEEYDAHLIVDEAHATGCFGPCGSGLVDAGRLRDRVLATVHTGGKALGVMGAYICGSRQLKELLINKCRHLIFTTALPPIIGSWWLDAIRFVQQDDAGRLALHDNARLFQSLLTAAGISVSGDHYILSVLLGSDSSAVNVAQHLQRHGYDIRAIRPPTVPEGTSRLRISIHADHEKDILRNVAEILVSAIEKSKSFGR